MSLVPAVHLLPLVKSRNNESSPKLPFYTARLIADRAIICLLFNRFSTVLPEGSIYYTIVFPPFCQYAVKQTDETVSLFKRFDLSVLNETEPNRTDNVILSHTVRTYVCRYAVDGTMQPNFMYTYVHVLCT